VKVMLDTNICIYIIKRRPSAVLERFTGFAVGDIGISVITLAELNMGPARVVTRKETGMRLSSLLNH